MMRKVTLLLVGTALALPGAAEAGRFAVGVGPGTDPQSLAKRLEARTGGSASVIGPFAVALSAPSARGIAGMRGVAYVERLSSRRLAFVPTDPLYARQWYIPAVRGFESWVQRPALPGMKIAVIDSGIDGDHPEFRGRIANWKSFVGGSALRDAKGHGTFVAGLMAARLDNGEGIAGMAFPAQLVVAKVVRSDGVVPLEAEARAIRWAVDKGARVINLSLGGVRDPLDPDHDSYSQLEANAVEYAIRKGAIVVAAVGNSDQAPEQPWRYASYPAALPHVLGVSALTRDGSVPPFSNRDAIYNDIAAPGDELVSTLPRELTKSRPTCLEQGYSDCGPTDFRRPQGTSFAAAIVSAAAVLVRGAWPALRAEQIVALMERSAADQTQLTGCRRCASGRDSLTGWGRLDVAAAVGWNANLRLPAVDDHEPNDDAGARSITVKRKKRFVTLRASVDFWDDQNDVYGVRLKRGQRLRAVLLGPDTADLNLVFWRPGTKRVDDHRTVTNKLINHSKQRRGATQRLSHRAGRAGLYYVQVKISSPGAAAYRLRLIR
jgi:subtilisin family serine protease